VYTKSTDIYAFGMTVLQMVTGRLPYAECDNHGTIWRKVTKHHLPECFHSVRHSSVRRFILKCINADASGKRPTAEELLADPFLQVRLPSGTPRSVSEDDDAERVEDPDIGGITESDEDESFTLVFERKGTEAASASSSANEGSSSSAHDLDVSKPGTPTSGDNASASGGKTPVGASPRTDSPSRLSPDRLDTKDAGTVDQAQTLEAQDSDGSNQSPGAVHADGSKDNREIDRNESGTSVSSEGGLESAIDELNVGWEKQIRTASMDADANASSSIDDAVDAALDGQEQKEPVASSDASPAEAVAEPTQ